MVRCGCTVADSEGSGHDRARGTSGGCNGRSGSGSWPSDLLDGTCSGDTFFASFAPALGKYLALKLSRRKVQRNALLLASRASLGQVLGPQTFQMESAAGCFLASFTCQPWPCTWHAARPFARYMTKTGASYRRTQADTIMVAIKARSGGSTTAPTHPALQVIRSGNPYAALAPRCGSTCRQHCAWRRARRAAVCIEPDPQRGVTGDQT